MIPTVIEHDLKVLLVSPKIPPIGGMSTFTKSLLDESVKTDLKNQHKQMQQVLNKIDDALTEVKAKESNSQILEIINKSMAKN